jgi:hypothetical protein
MGEDWEIFSVEGGENKAQMLFTGGTLFTWMI